MKAYSFKNALDLTETIHSHIWSFIHQNANYGIRFEDITDVKKISKVK